MSPVAGADLFDGDWWWLAAGAGGWPPQIRPKVGSRVRAGQPSSSVRWMRSPAAGPAHARRGRARSAAAPGARSYGTLAPARRTGQTEGCGRIPPLESGQVSPMGAAADIEAIRPVRRRVQLRHSHRREGRHLCGHDEITLVVLCGPMDGGDDRVLHLDAIRGSPTRQRTSGGSGGRNTLEVGVREPRWEPPGRTEWRRCERARTTTPRSSRTDGPI